MPLFAYNEARRSANQMGLDFRGTGFEAHYLNTRENAEVTGEWMM